MDEDEFNILNLLNPIEKNPDIESEEIESIDPKLGTKIGNALRLYYDEFIRKEEFIEGQLITWKLGLRNRNFPRYNEPAIIIKILDDPIPPYDYFSPEHPYFTDNFDLCIGVHIDGNMFNFYVDSRRFTTYL